MIDMHIKNLGSFLKLLIGSVFGTAFIFVINPGNNSIVEIVALIIMTICFAILGLEYNSTMNELKDLP